MQLHAYRNLKMLISYLQGNEKIKLAGGKLENRLGNKMLQRIRKLENSFVNSCITLIDQLIWIG